jgi:hypothetical protein
MRGKPWTSTSEAAAKKPARMAVLDLSEAGHDSGAEKMFEGHRTAIQVDEDLRGG